MPQGRKRPHSLPKNVRPSIPTLNGNKEDHIKEIEVYYEPMERDSNGLIISCTNTISEKAFNNIN